MSDVSATACPSLDLRDQVCPMTFVRTRLALDQLEGGALLRILLAGEEPQRRVPQTVRQLGHQVVDQALGPDGTLQLLIRKRVG